MGMGTAMPVSSPAKDDDSRPSLRCAVRGDASWISAAAVVGLMLPTWSVAADWTFRPRVEVRETYTDNLRLAPKGAEESDFVTEVEPGISIQAQGARLKLQADYAFQYRLYARNWSENGHNHALSSDALLDAWNRELFLQASASIRQQNISPLGRQTFNNVNVTGNRTEVRQASVSPFWVKRFGPWTNVEARYTWSRIDSSSETRQFDTETRQIGLSASSGEAFNVLGWQVSYTKQEIESTAGQFPERELE